MSSFGGTTLSSRLDPPVHVADTVVVLSAAVERDKDKDERQFAKTHLQDRFATGISWLCSCAIQTAKILRQDTQTLTRNERIAAIAIVGIEEIDEEIIAIRPTMIRLMNLTTTIPTTPIAHDEQDVVAAVP